MSADSVMGGPLSATVVIPALYPTHNGKPRKLGTVERFALSALAPAVAVFFTNPFDTAKVRLQLQGQRAKASNSALGVAAGAVKPAAADVYRNSFDAIYKILKNEGIRGIQKGLFPAVLKEGSKNFFRIGMYDPIMTLIHDPKTGSSPPWKRMLAGSICGVMGAFSCNPFELIKTRLQSQVSAQNAHQAVGHQFQYKSSWDALMKTYQADGVKGLYRGSALSMARSFIGSGVNLTTYSMTKEYLILKRNWKDDWVVDMVAGLGSGVMSCAAMNPIDVVRTRYYNQPYVNGKGQLYSSGMDAIMQIVRNEGPRSFYKGFTTHFLRIGPHFCCKF
ncbi:mitochondrial carrier domain-containing protein [Chytriomyces sp. MP71]|nr:mitochondrial carrier domain-containing protein [Chytriomyces sp. MP71]